jgi:hypothetical protein
VGVLFFHLWGTDARAAGTAGAAGVLVLGCAGAVGCAASAARKLFSHQSSTRVLVCVVVCVVACGGCRVLAAAPLALSGRSCSLLARSKYRQVVPY